MSARDNKGNIHSMSEQVQFGRGQAQSSSGQLQSSCTDKVINCCYIKTR